MGAACKWNVTKSDVSGSRGNEREGGGAASIKWRGVDVFTTEETTSSKHGLREELDIKQQQPTGTGEPPFAAVTHQKLFFQG